MKRGNITTNHTPKMNNSNNFKQPQSRSDVEALRLADELQSRWAENLVCPEIEAAAELRRLHKENSALRREVAALSANALDDYKMIQSLMAERQPLTDEQRKNILAMWSRENRNYTVADIIDAVEAAHGIKGEA